MSRRYRGRSLKSPGVAAYIPPRRGDYVDEVLARSASNDDAGILDEFDTNGSHMPTWRLSEERRAAEARDRDLYGELLADVLFLRSRDFTVTLDALDDAGLPCLLCDGRPTTAHHLHEKAQRERRLLQEKAAA